MSKNISQPCFSFKLSLIPKETSLGLQLFISDKWKKMYLDCSFNSLREKQSSLETMGLCLEPWPVSPVHNNEGYFNPSSSSQGDLTGRRQCTFRWLSDKKGTHMCVSHSLMSYSLQLRGPTRLLCPWDSPYKNTGVGCHALLQGIFPAQGSNPCLPHCRQTLYCLSYPGGQTPNWHPGAALRTFIKSEDSEASEPGFHGGCFWASVHGSNFWSWSILGTCLWIPDATSS